MKEKDYSISLVRFVAMVFIFICHICKQFDTKTSIGGGIIEWKNWFNVGVQCFLLISGYLYGKRKNIDNILEWYKKVFLKILLDYYVFVLIMIPVYYFFSPNGVEVSDIIHLLTFSGTIEGLGHLWYIPTILFCYLLTPLTLLLVESLMKRPFAKVIMGIIIFLMAVQIVIMLFFDFFSAAWINCYVIGILCSYLEGGKYHRFLGIFVIIISIAAVVFQIYGELIDLGLKTHWASVWGLYSNYVHVLLGLTIMICLRGLWEKIGDRHNRLFLRILDWSDKYSYDVYFVHAVFTQGFLCFALVIQNRAVAISLSVVSTILAAMLLRRICSCYIRKKHS